MTTFFQINVFWPFLLQIHSSHSPFSCFYNKNPGKLHYFTIPIKPILKLIIEKIATSLKKDNFSQINVFWPILLQIHSSHSPFSCFHTKNPGKLHYFTIPIKPILKLIIGENCNFFKGNFFSNKRILANSFADSQLTWSIQLLLYQKSRKIALFHNTNKTYFKTDYRENCNFLIATFLNNDNFFSNKRILAMSFADSQLT